MGEKKDRFDLIRGKLLKKAVGMANKEQSKHMDNPQPKDNIYTKIGTQNTTGRYGMTQPTKPLPNFHTNCPDCGAMVRTWEGAWIDKCLCKDKQWPMTQPTSLEGVKREFEKKFGMPEQVENLGITAGNDFQLRKRRLFKEWTVELYENVWQFISQQISIAEERGIKLGKEAGINSTYPCTNLDNETMNCELCGHDHSAASKYCRCECCTYKSTKQE